MRFDKSRTIDGVSVMVSTNIFATRTHLVLRTVLVALTVSLSACDSDPTFELPGRPRNAPGGTEISRQIRGLDLEAREDRILKEVARGNVPSWVRTLKSIELTKEIDGRAYTATFWATPNYLAVGSDEDPFLTPLSPITAQRIAHLLEAGLPTPFMVDAIWLGADVRLEPTPIPPSPEMTTVRVFEDHNQLIRDQLMYHDVRTGSIVAGHKKDVVVTARLDSLQGRVAIYGWHKLDGVPIQPLYTGHTERWVDYSHGIRLVDRRVLVNGTRHDLVDILQDPTLAPLFNEGGVIATPSYKVSFEPETGNQQKRKTRTRF